MNKTRLMALLSLSLSCACAAQTINPNQIRPSATSGEVLTTVVGGQPPSWQPNTAGGGSATFLACWLTATTLTSCNATDTGGVLSVLEQLAVQGSTAKPNMSLLEVTPGSPGLVNYDNQWADAAAHWPKFNPNNTASYFEMGADGAGTAGQCWLVGSHSYDALSGVCGGNFQMAITPPISGQSIIIYPTSVTPSAAGCSFASGVATGQTATGSFGAVSCPSGTRTAQLLFDGFTLSGTGVSAGSVTAIYPVVVSSFVTTTPTQLNNNTTAGLPGDSYGAYSLQNDSTSNRALAQSPTTATSWVGTDIPNIGIKGVGTGSTCGTPGCLGGNPTLSSATTLATVALAVYYTGSPITSPTVVNVVPPLQITPAGLGISPSAEFPGLGSVGVTSAQALPIAAAYNTMAVYVTDATSTSNCTGGGSVSIFCVYTASGGGGLIPAVASSGGGDTITSPGSTLSVGGTSTNTTLDINLGHANTYTATQTFPSASITNAELANPATTVNGQTCTLGSTCTISSTVANALTMNNSGSGAASGATFDGSAARTLSYNTIGAAPASTAMTSLTGDVTGTGPGATATTLATVNSGPGSCGDATHVCQITTNGKGLTTAQTAVAITGGGGGAGVVLHGVGAPTAGTPATMTHVQSTPGGNSNAIFGSNVTSGNLLVCQGTGESFYAPATIPTDTLGTIFKSAAYYQTAGIIANQFWLGIPTSTGADTVTTNQVSGSVAIVCDEFSGATPLVDVIATPVTGSQTPSTTVITATAGELLYGAFTDARTGGTPTFTAGSGFTLGVNYTGSITFNPQATEYLLGASSGSHAIAMSETGNTSIDQNFMGIAIYAQATGGCTTGNWYDNLLNSEFYGPCLDGVMAPGGALPLNGTLPDGVLSPNNPGGINATSIGGVQIFGPATAANQIPITTSAGQAQWVTNPLSGGTSGCLPLWTSSTTLGTSAWCDTGSALNASESVNINLPSTATSISGLNILYTGTNSGNGISVTAPQPEIQLTDNESGSGDNTGGNFKIEANNFQGSFGLTRVTKLWSKLGNSFNAPVFEIYANSSSVAVMNLLETGVWGISGSGGGQGPADIGWSRCAAGVACFGNGNQGDTTGTVETGNIQTTALTQQAASNTGGTCSMGGTTSCTITIAHTYTTPVCIATQQSATLTGGAVGCTVSGTTVTITSAVLNSETWGAFVFGNPN